MSAPPDPTPQQVVELAVNLDDVSGEVVGHAVQTLLDEGALDAWTTPIQMKKQRPGVQLSVLVPAENQWATAQRVLALTGSFGVRFRAWDRLTLQREVVEVQTPFGPLPIKVGRLDGRVLTAQPEFDPAAAAAAAHGVSPRQVMDAARAAAQPLLDGGPPA